MDELLVDVLEVELPIEDEAEFDRQAQLMVAKLQKLRPADLTAGNAIDILDPSAQTIPFLYILNAHIDETVFNGKAHSHSRLLPPAVLPEGSLWPHITRLLVDFDPIQVRYAGDLFSRVVAIVSQGAEQTANLVPAIQLLRTVILRLDPSSSTLTWTHYSFIRICLLARAYSEAVDILDRPIYSIPGEPDAFSTSLSYKYLCSNHESSSIYLTPSTGLTMKITTRGYMEYFLMGGMCYMALGEFAKALFFLEVVLVMPTVQNSASMVMVEAYKKWLLVGLLLDGKRQNTPRAANASAMKQIKAVAKPYDCLVDAFKSQSLARLRGEIEEGQEIWDRDCNTGLVLEVFHAFRKFSVLNLGNTFAALSIAEVSQRTSPDASDLDETIGYVSSLISSGRLNAILDPPSQTGGLPTLRFLPSASNLKTEAQIQQDLAAKTIELQSILKHISDNDHRLEINREYIDWLKRLRRQKEIEWKGEGLGKAGPFDDLEEDMMADF